MTSSRSAHLAPPIARLIACTALLACLWPHSAAARSDLPFSPAFAKRVEETFFDESGAVSAQKIEAFRAPLQARQDEMLAVLSARYEDSGRSPEAAESRSRRRKRYRYYGILLEEQYGWLAELATERDSRKARELAARIIEVDYALRIEGARPWSMRIYDNLTWATIRPWHIPRRSDPKQTHKEASNLYDPLTGTFLEADELAAMIERNEDISRLNPQPGSSFWRDPGAIDQRDVYDTYYRGGDALHEFLPAHFPSKRAKLEGIRKSQTKPKFEITIADESGKREYKLKVGGEIHSESTVNSLLATLGFNVDVTRYVRNFRLDLGDVDVEALRREWRTYFENHRTHNRFEFDDYFAEGEDAEGRYLLVKEGTIEEKPKSIWRLGPWPFGGNGNEGRREVRGLAVFSAWVANADLKEAENNKIVARIDRPGPEIFHLQHDIGHSLGRIIPEQLNAYPWDLIERAWDGHIALNYHSVQPTSLRKRITYADARWMVRQIAQLTRNQISNAVGIGNWPQPAARVLVEKLSYRRNQLVEAFDLLGENTPSGPIRMLPADRHLSSDDGEIVDGKLTSGQYAGSTQNFANYWEELLGPVLDKALLASVGLLQASVGEVVELIFDPENVGLPTGLVVELLANLNREIEENPSPSGPEDQYIVSDVLLIGARLGGGYVLRGEGTYWRKYTLIQPVGTVRAGRYADGTILDLVLPRRISRGELPERYVLSRESYLDGRLRLITDDISAGTPAAGLEMTFARALLSREIVSRQGERIRVFLDTTRSNVSAWRAFLTAVFVRLPLVGGKASNGRDEGVLYVLDDAFRSEPEAVQAALSELLRRGDTGVLDPLARPVRVESNFRQRESWAKLLIFLSHRSWRRRDDIEISAPDDPLFPSRRFVQHFVGRTHYWSFLDYREASRALLLAMIERTADGRSQTPVIQATFFENDRNVRSKELDEGYLRFVNSIADPMPTSDRSAEEILDARLIRFSPESHTTNQRWGHLYATTVIGFAPAAVDALLELESTVYWSELARTLGIASSELARYRRGLTHRDRVQRRIRRRRTPPVARRAIRQSNLVLERLESARSQEDDMARYGDVVHAIAATAYRSGQGYDPSVLATLRRMVGPDHVSVDVRIAPPQWVEMRLLGKVDLVGHTHSDPFRPPHAPVIFEPESGIALYHMLDWMTDAVRWTSDRDDGDRPDVTIPPALRIPDESS